MDLSLPSPAYLAGSLIFGIIGFAAYRYGKSTDQYQTRWLGVGLMVYPYAISQTWLLYLLGAILCGCLYFFRD
jgi:hypothetical protein